MAKVLVLPEAERNDTGNDSASEEDEDGLSMVTMDSIQHKDGDDEEGEQEEKVSFDNQMEILMCRKIICLREEDRLADVPGDIVAEFGAMLTTRQRRLLFSFLRRVPMGVLLLLGPAGTGKSFAIAAVIIFKIAAGRKVSVIAPSNVAAIAIADKVKTLDQHNRLLLRPWSACEEEAAIMRYVHGSKAEEWKHIVSSPWRGHDRFIPELSVAEAVLKMCGVLKTTNGKLISLREHNSELAEILSTQPDLRTDSMNREFRRLARRACKAVMSITDASFSTSAPALSDLVKKFTKSAHDAVVEEAGNAVEAQVVNSWQGDHKTITFAGDFKQLPPAALSKDVRHALAGAGSILTST